MMNYLKMAYRNLGRNRRRSILSAMALSLGLTLLIFMSAFMRGEIRSALESSIRLQSGHLQLRAASYEEEKLSLAWEDLIANPEQIIAQLKPLEQVKEATPRLQISGILAIKDESPGVQILGIDPDSPANEPYVEGMLSGSFLSPDDREGILVGYPLAQNLGLSVGDKVNLLVNTSNGDVDEQEFIVRGIFSTGTPNYDKTTILMPISKAQAMGRAEDHASIIFIMLNDLEQSSAVAAALRTSNLQVKTWIEMNELVIETENFSNAYMILLNLIVLGITATVIVNTLVMAVFERTRELGILSAIGMKGRQITSLVLTEASLLAMAGLAVGLVAGSLLSAYFAEKGIYLGDLGITGILFGERIYTYLMVEDVINLTVMTLIVTLLASLYPARLASHMEPVEALHGKN